MPPASVAGDVGLIFGRKAFISLRQGLSLHYPDVLRGETIIYGGAEDSFIASDLRMKRRVDCTTEDDLIAKLKSERTTLPVGTEHPHGSISSNASEKRPRYV